MKRPSLDIVTKHQLRIARHTLRMTDEGAAIMGGMTKDEAREILRKRREVCKQARKKG